jgi:hypothetical protein
MEGGKKKLGTKIFNVDMKGGGGEIRKIQFPFSGPQWLREEKELCFRDGFCGGGLGTDGSFGAMEKWMSKLIDWMGYADDVGRKN